MSRPDWHTQAACKTWPNPDDFFTDDSEVSETVTALCHTCPVRDQCFNWAARTGQVGYWAATTERQRTALMLGIPRAKCPACSAPEPFRRDNTQVCGFCGIAWEIKPGKTPAPHVSAT